MEIRDNRRFSFTMIDNDIIDDIEKFNSNEVMAYMVLCRYANNETNKCFPSYNTIAKLMRVSRPTAIKAISALVEKGVVLVERKRKADGNNESNVYTILGYKKGSTASDTVEPAQNNLSNNSICSTGEKHTPSVTKIINESNVNIKKEDMEKCLEEFTDIDKLKEALKICEDRNSHGIKALRLAYNSKNRNGNSKGKKKAPTQNFDSKHMEDKNDDYFEALRRNQLDAIKKEMKNTPAVTEYKFK